MTTLVVAAFFLDAQLVELVSNSQVTSARLVILTSQNLGLSRLVFLSSRVESSRALSVRKVVPTLTSNKRWDQPLDGSVLATN
jgi:hypothetical protein